MNYCNQCFHPADDHKGSPKPEPPGLREFRRDDLRGVCELTYKAVMAQPYGKPPPAGEAWHEHVDDDMEARLNEKYASWQHSQTRRTLASAIAEVSAFKIVKGGKVEFSNGPQWAKKAIEDDGGLLAFVKAILVET